MPCLSPAMPWMVAHRPRQSAEGPEPCCTHAVMGPAIAVQPIPCAARKVALHAAALTCSRLLESESQEGSAWSIFCSLLHCPLSLGLCHWLLQSRPVRLGTLQYEGRHASGHDTHGFSQQWGLWLLQSGSHQMGACSLSDQQTTSVLMPVQLLLPDLPAIAFHDTICALVLTTFSMTIKQREGGGAHAKVNLRDQHGSAGPTGEH